jgi:ABC-type lipoprotein release transport system permease subunit
MLKFKVLRNKKAFSAIIASLILMLLAVAAGVVVYAYVMGWIGGTQQSSTNTGILSVDSLTATVNGSKIQLYVRNSGGNDLVLDKFYIEVTAVTNATALTSTNKQVAVQGTAYLEFSGITPALQTNKFYEVKVVCTDGTIVSSSVQAK